MTTTIHRAGGSRGANGYGEYKVRYASEKQKSFIQNLLNTKDHNYNDLNLDELNVQGAGEIITTLLACNNKAGIVIPPTEKQLEYAKALVQKKEGGEVLLANVLQQKGVQEINQLSKTDVSAIINGLRYAKEKPEVLKITEVGAYLLDEVIYSIRYNTDQKKWSVWSYSDVNKKWIKDETKHDVLKKLEPSNRLTLQQAVKYSAQTGLCCHCGRTLTVLKSVAGGIGPICAEKYK